MLLLLTWHHHLFGQLLVLPMYFFKLAISLLKIFTTRPHLQQKFYVSTWPHSTQNVNEILHDICGNFFINFGTNKRLFLSQHVLILTWLHDTGRFFNVSFSKKNYVLSKKLFSSMAQNILMLGVHFLQNIGKLSVCNRVLLSLVLSRAKPTANMRR